MKTGRTTGQSLVETVILNTLIVSGILAILSASRGWVQDFVISLLDLTAGPLP